MKDEEWHDGFEEGFRQGLARARIEYNAGYDRGWKDAWEPIHKKLLELEELKLPVPIIIKREKL